MGWVVNATARRFTTGKETRYPLYGRVRKISPAPGFDPRTAQLVASRYTDCGSGGILPFTLNRSLKERERIASRSSRCTSRERKTPQCTDLDGCVSPRLGLDTLKKRRVSWSSVDHSTRSRGTIPNELTALNLNQSDTQNIGT